MSNRYPVDCPPEDVLMKFKTRRCPADDPPVDGHFSRYPVVGSLVDFVLMIPQSVFFFP